MEYGLTLPTIGPAASPESILRVAEGAERIGVSSLWVNERVLRTHAPFRYRGGELTLPATLGVNYAPLETLAYVAARTTRARLGTSVLLSLLHGPVALGQRLATLDRLSGGRVIAGIGIPHMEAEYDAGGLPFSAKGDRFAEFVRVLRAVWGPDPVTFDGRFYRVPASDTGPKPVQPGGPPILVGASHLASVRRAAEMGLGLNPQARGGSFDEVAPLVEEFRTVAAATGHDPDSLPVVLRVGGGVGDDPSGARPLLGTPEQVVAELPRLEALGVRHVIWGGLAADRDVQLERMERVLALVDPLLRTVR